MKIYVLNVYLADNQPIRRTLKLMGTHTLKTVHHTIVQAFHMHRASKARMHAATDKWRKKEKFLLARLPDDKEHRLMEEVTLDEFYSGKYKNLLYEVSTYRPWTFNIEPLKIVERKRVNPKEYPDWDKAQCHSLNEYKKDLILTEDDEEELVDFIDDNLDEAIKDLDISEDND